MIKLNLKDSYQFIFWEESRNQIECIEREILAVEAENYDEETIQLLFRMAHSLKGSTATMEINEMARVAHVLEDLLTLIKNHVVNLDDNLMAIILEAIDILKWLHELLTIDVAFTPELLSEIEQSVVQIELKIKQCSGFDKPLKTNHDVLMDTLEIFPDNAKGLRVIFEKSAEMLSVKAYMIIQALSQLGVVLKAMPVAYEDLDDESFNRQFQVFLQTEETDQTLIDALQSISELESIAFIHNIGESVNENKSSPSRSVNPVNLDVTSVRISIEKINQLINLVGELTLNKEILFDVTKALKKTYKKDKNILRLEEACESIQFLGSELQEIVLNARLIPLEAVFSKFHRMVRDVANETGKRIKLEIEGNDQGVDRSIIEELSDPLTHLIRNAVDHGIETPENRIQKGKPAEGILKVKAWQSNNQVVIVIEDDGNGIDIDKIKVKALSKQLISIEEASHLNESEWLEFVFRPGFSTANEVTTLSGRGVGLDIVKSNITKINGHIDLLTERGKGSKFTIKLPLTMAIMNVLLVKEEACIFGIPTSQIVEIIRLTESDFSEKIYKTEYSKILNWSDTTIPMVYLSEMFSLESDPEKKKLFIVILGTAERKMAMVVERILGEQEVVIKPMREFVGKDKIFGELYEISGVSVLGNGSLAQIIDVSMVDKI